MPEGGWDTHCLKIILKKIYGNRQAGRTWAQHICEGLISLGLRKVMLIIEYSTGDQLSLWLMLMMESFSALKRKRLIKCLKDMNSIFNLTN